MSTGYSKNEKNLEYIGTESKRLGPWLEHRVEYKCTVTGCSIIKRWRQHVGGVPSVAEAEQAGKLKAVIALEGPGFWKRKGG